MTEAEFRVLLDQHVVELTQRPQVSVVQRRIILLNRLREDLDDLDENGW